MSNKTNTDSSHVVEFFQFVLRSSIIKQSKDMNKTKTAPFSQEQALVLENTCSFVYGFFTLSNGIELGCRSRADIMLTDWHTYNDEEPDYVYLLGHYIL